MTKLREPQFHLLIEREDSCETEGPFYFSTDRDEYIKQQLKVGDYTGLIYLDISTEPHGGFNIKAFKIL